MQKSQVLLFFVITREECCKKRKKKKKQFCTQCWMVACRKYINNTPLNSQWTFWSLLQVWRQHRETLKRSYKKVSEYAQILWRADAATNAAWRRRKCTWRGLQNLPYSLTWKCPIWHLFYGHFTHALSDVGESWVFFISGEENKQGTHFEKFVGCSKYPNTRARFFAAWQQVEVFQKRRE